MKGCSSLLLFSSDWAISSPVLGAAYYRLTLVSLVSEPSSVFPEAWMLIGIYVFLNRYLAFQQFKQFSSIYSYIVGPSS